MGKLLSSYKENLINELIDNIASNTSQYYAFASHPKSYSNGIPNITDDDYSTNYEFNWHMMFGKRISNTDIIGVVENNKWVSNTIYDRYDNNDTELYSNNNFYVVSEPYEVGGVYHIYKCIDNSNNSPSTVDPGSIGTPTQSTTFKTGDNYKWRYITSISSVNYNKFSTTDYIPIYANSLISASASAYSGIEVIKIVNNGIGYDSYSNGIIQSIVNSTLIQIESASSSDNFYYNNNAIYIYNTSLGTSQILSIKNYISNTIGKWIYLESEANTSKIISGQSEYIISPKVVFDTDGDSDPIAYSVINTYSNSIDSIEILDIGSNITRASVSIESSFGSGANLVAIVPPPGGHGANPINELNVKGFSLVFTFSNTESNTIVTSNVLFNKIGLIKNPHSLQSNGSKGTRIYSNTFNQILKANVSPSYTFTLGEEVIGDTSKAKGIVTFSNSTHLYLVGDKCFSNQEFIGNTTSSNLTQITVITKGDVYTKDIRPFYVNNINNLNRSDSENESFKIIIQI